MRARGAAVLVAVGDRRLEPLVERLGGRAVVQVLEPLAGGDRDAALLLLDVRHTREKAPTGRADRSSSRSFRPLAYPRSGDDRGGGRRRPIHRAAPPPRLVDSDLLGRDRGLPDPRPRPRDHRAARTSASRARSTPSRSRSRCRTSSARSPRTSALGGRVRAGLQRAAREGAARARLAGRLDALLARPPRARRRDRPFFMLAGALDHGPLRLGDRRRSSRRPRRGCSSRVVLLMGVSGIVVGILNSYEEFTVPALMPVLWNLAIIVALVVFVPRFDSVEATALRLRGRHPRRHGHPGGHAGLVAPGPRRAHPRGARPARPGGQACASC